MSNFKLNLPTDIPWKRICVTEDMIDRKIGDGKFPLRWQSSMAIFEFTPEEEYQNYEGMTVSYLKVACTITGFQPKGDEVGLHNNQARSGVRDSATGDYLIDPSRWSDTRVIQAYKDAIEDYYGCYGAILEVAVSPKGSKEELEKIPSSKFPYFIDFEPKKRELYEVVTETGEMMSRSLSALNVKKGSTTTEAHEVLDIFGGVSAQGSFAGTGGGASVQGQWGTKDLNQTDYVDMRTTDGAREKRESYSHATQLTQMYHQLNSYHIGTNRATFYILPRPHIVQLSSDEEETDRSTFVNGPRLLEGIQEFFLVVIRPKEIKDICVEAYLETAHIFQEKIPQFTNADNLIDQFVVNGSLNESEGETERIESEEEAKDFLDRVVEGASGAGIGLLVGGPIGATIGAIFGAAWDEAFGDTLDKTTLTALNSRFTPSSPDLEFDLSRRSLAYCSPIGERKQYIGCELVNFDTDEATFVGSVFSQQFTENFIFIDTGTKREIGKATINIQIPQRFKEPKLIDGNKSLFLTGRGIKCCTSNAPEVTTFPPSIVWEGSLDAGIKYDVEIGRNRKVSKVEANRIGENIANQLYKSVNDSNRKPRGETFFAESNFFANTIAKTIEVATSDNISAKKVKGLSLELQKVLSVKARGVTRKELLTVPIHRLMIGLDIEYEQALELRRTLLGLVKVKDAPDKPEIEETKIEVPNLVGLKLSEYSRVLTKLKLRAGNTQYEDNDCLKNVVLKQDPEKGTEVIEGSFIDLVLSTGASVRVPDIESENLTNALILLRRAGLKSEPEICYVYTEDKCLVNQVKDVCPVMRTYITPNSKVKLKVFSINQDYQCCKD